MSKPGILSLEEKINEPKRQVLWQNTSSSSEMGADTIINLSNSDYDELEWLFIYSNATANLSNQQSFNCQKGNSITLFSIGYSTGVSVRRTIDRVSDTQYKTRAGIRNTEESNTYCIPVAVIGIKY